MLAVAEAARNVACAGGLPIGATNCLNFGNPEKPEIMWQLVQAVEGIAEACRALDVPITGGNVSLYNETDGTGIYPTPIIGVVGVIEDASATLGRAFRAAGRDIVLLGESDGRLDGSEYLKSVHGIVAGQAPALDLDRERGLIKLLVEAARQAADRIRARLCRRRRGRHAGRMRLRHRRHRLHRGRAGRPRVTRATGPLWARSSANRRAASSFRSTRRIARHCSGWPRRRACR